MIIRTQFPGQAPQMVEDQVTYPLTTTMLSVPGAKTVRGYSFFGDSYIYILFDDKTDPYWARSRVLEYLNQVTPAASRRRSPRSGRTRPASAGFTNMHWSTVAADTILAAACPAGLVPEVRIEDRAERGRGGERRRHGEAVPGRARPRPYARAYGMPHVEGQRSDPRANSETGGSVLEMGEAEYMVRATGYLKGLDDFAQIPLGVGPTARRSCWATSRASRSARKSGAASRSWTAEARSRAA